MLALQQAGRHRTAVHTRGADTVTFAVIIAICSSTLHMVVVGMNGKISRSKQPLTFVSTDPDDAAACDIMCLRFSRLVDMGLLQTPAGLAMLVLELSLTVSCYWKCIIEIRRGGFGGVHSPRRDLQGVHLCTSTFNTRPTPRLLFLGDE